jgi:hypothetical protein
VKLFIISKKLKICIKNCFKFIIKLILSGLLLKSFEFMVKFDFDFSKSKKIFNFGLTQELKRISSTDQLKIQKNIRNQALKYLKEFLFQLPTLPNLDEYEKLVEQNERGLLVFENVKQKREITSVSFSNNEWAVSFNQENDGDDETVDDDVIRMQISVFEKHLENASKENRVEDIEICKRNLNELTIVLNSRNYRFI